jgi:limonene-1,2-epoxide hydrolase
MTTAAMLRAFCDAVESRNGRAFAELFTEDGVYHDVFYGAFEGREKIAALIDDWFVDLKFAPARIAKIAGKQGAELKARPEMKRHLA